MDDMEFKAREMIHKHGLWMAEKALDDKWKVDEILKCTQKAIALLEVHCQQARAKADASGRAA